MLIDTKISKFTGFHCVEVLAGLWVSFPTGFYVAVLDGADLVNMLLLLLFHCHNCSKREGMAMHICTINMVIF